MRDEDTATIAHRSRAAAHPGSPIGGNEEIIKSTKFHPSIEKRLIDRPARPGTRYALIPRRKSVRA
jgi:hypothetical protein